MTWGEERAQRLNVQPEGITYRDWQDGKYVELTTTKKLHKMTKLGHYSINNKLVHWTDIKDYNGPDSGYF